MKKEDLQKDASAVTEVASLGANRVYRILVAILLVMMLLEWIFLLFNQRWLAMFLTSLIIATLLSPLIFRHQMNVEIPAEFHIAAVIFIFASLYLGEIQGFYQAFWWWDMVLHTSAGLLLGIVGFFLVYLLNADKRIDMHMTPVFISLFAFMFAVALGTFWEIFEFSMDQLVGTTMQKPMLNDTSGLTDTMWDMIVNAMGAFAVSFTGWQYLKRKRDSLVKTWINWFIKKNPRFFTEV